MEIKNTKCNTQKTASFFAAYKSLIFYIFDYSAWSHEEDWPYIRVIRKWPEEGCNVNNKGMVWTLRMHLSGPG
jgi:hypothetical protein